MATDEKIQQLDEVADLFMKLYAEGDLEVMAKSCFSQDCVIMPPDGTIVHYSGIKDLFAKSGIKRWMLVNDESVIEGNMAVKHGHYTGYREDGSVVGSGRYMSMFVQRDGKWLVKSDIWTMGQ